MREIVKEFIDARIDIVNYSSAEEHYNFARKQNLVNKQLFNDTLLDGNDTKIFSVDSLGALDSPTADFDIILSTRPSSYQKNEILDTFILMQQADTFNHEQQITTIESFLIDVSMQIYAVDYDMSLAIRQAVTKFVSTLPYNLKFTRKLSKVGTFLATIPLHTIPRIDRGTMNLYINLYNEMYLLYTNFLGKVTVDTQIPKEIIITTNFDMMMMAGDTGNVGTCLSPTGCNRGLTTLYASASNIGVAYVVRKGCSIDKAIARCFIYLGDNGFGIGEMYPRHFSSVEYALKQILNMENNEHRSYSSPNIFLDEMLEATSTSIMYSGASYYDVQTEFLCMCCGKKLDIDDDEVFTHYDADGRALLCTDCLEYDDEEDDY